MNRGWAAKVRKNKSEQVGCRLTRGVQHCTLTPYGASHSAQSRNSEKVETARIEPENGSMRVIFTSAERRTPLRGILATAFV
jgi:hypothetical protein